MGAKLSFELDAGKILAKLHRGACQTREKKDKVLFFNTGIVNDSPVDPEKVDGSGMEFDMDGGEYELGVVLTKDAVLQINAEAAKTKAANGDIMSKEVVTDFIENVLDKYLADEKKEIHDVDDKKWDEFCQDLNAGYGAKVKTKDFKARVMQLYGDVHEKDEKDEKKPGGEKSTGEDTPIMQSPDQIKEDYTEMDSNVPGSVPLDDLVAAMLSPEDDEFTRLEKDAKGAAAQTVKAYHDAVKEFMEQRMNNATVFLQDYMRTFAGEDEAKNVTVDKVSVTYLPKGMDNPYKIKKYEKYQIPALTDEQVRKEKIKQLKPFVGSTYDPEELRDLDEADDEAEAKKPGKVEFSYENMCFKIAYALDIGK